MPSIFDQIIDMSEDAGFGYKFGKIPKVSGLVIHHTGGRGNVDSVLQTFRERNFPAQFIVDRDGKIYRALPDGARGQHIKDGQGVGEGLSNANTLGIEVIARDNNDWTDAERNALAPFVKGLGEKYGFDPLKSMFGHGEINSHKLADEGLSFVDWYRKNQGQLPSTLMASANGVASIPPVNGVRPEVIPGQQQTAMAPPMQPPIGKPLPPITQRTDVADLPEGGIAPSQIMMPQQLAANLNNSLFGKPGDAKPGAGIFNLISSLAGQSSQQQASEQAVQQAHADATQRRMNWWLQQQQNQLV